MWRDNDVRPERNEYPNPFPIDYLSTGFWRDWYQAFLDGKPLDWDLQREVALIPDRDWNKGPAHIAERIEEVQAKFDVRAKAKETLSFFEQTQQPSVPGAGHNQGPPFEDALDIDLSNIRQSVEDALSETQKDRPNRSIFANTKQVLTAAMTTAAKYVAKKLDVAVDEVIKETVKFGTKAVLITWLLDLIGVLRPLIEAIKTYLPFL